MAFKGPFQPKLFYDPMTCSLLIFHALDKAGSGAGWSILNSCKKHKDWEGGLCSGCPQERFELRTGGLVWNVHLEDFRAPCVDAGVSSCAGGFLWVYLGGRVDACETSVDWVDVCEIPWGLFDLYTPTSYPTIELCVGVSGPKPQLCV